MKHRDFRFEDRKSCRLTVPSMAEEELRALIEAPFQVKASRTPSTPREAPLRTSLSWRTEHHCRALKALGDPTCDNPNYTLMPARISNENQRSARLYLGLCERLSGLEEYALNFTTLFVVLKHPLTERGSLFLRLRREETRPRVWVTQATARVQGGTEGETNIAAAELLPLEILRLAERAEPRPLAPPELLKTSANKRTVEATHRRHINEGADRNKI